MSLIYNLGALSTDFLILYGNYEMWIFLVNLLSMMGNLSLSYFKTAVMERDCIQFEPPHDETNKMTCAPSEDSDQSGPRLIRVLAVRIKKLWILGSP